MALLNITTEEEFKKHVIDSNKTVLVDFWAPWCPPCRAMAPTLDEVAKTMDEKLDVVKVNIEDSAQNAALATTYGVQGIPNMQIFKDGTVMDVLIGMRPAGALKQELKAYTQN